MESEVIYKVTKKDLKEFVTDTIKSEVKEQVFGMFHNVIIGTASCCEVLGINSVTLTAYLNETPPRVPSINSEKGKHHKFDLAEVLKVYQYIKDTKSKTVANLRFNKVGI